MWGGEEMKLNNILKYKRLTIQEVSEKTGINHHTLRKYSSCVREPSVKNAKILGRFLEIDWWLFFEEDEKGVGK